MANASELYTALDAQHPELSAGLHAARSNLLAITSARHPVLAAWQHSPALTDLSAAADDCYRKQVIAHADLITIDPDNYFYDALSPWPNSETAFNLYCDVYMAAAFTLYVPDEPAASTDPFRATYAALQELVAEYAAMTPLERELLVSLLTTWHASLPELLAATSTLSAPIRI